MLKNESTAYNDLKRIIRIIDPSSTEGCSSSPTSKRMKIDPDDENSGRTSRNGASSPSSTLKDWQKLQQEQLRGFKIPKQASTNGTASTISSGNSKLTAVDQPGSSSKRQQSSGSGNNNSNSYYHPKKNHYMMYMMENKACSQQTSPSKFKVRSKRVFFFLFGWV